MNYNLQLRTSKRYEWSRRDFVEPGSSILDIVEHGINKDKNSTECIYQLISELKHHANEDR